MVSQIDVVNDPSDEDRDAIRAPLVAYNTAAAGAPNFRKFALMIRNDSGEVTGGLYGYLAYDWFFVELLVVPDALRGQGLGGKLLAQAEAVARAGKCAGIWLDTFSFQAPEFYRKQGFSLIGSIDDYPRGHTRYFFKKYLT